MSKRPAKVWLGEAALAVAQISQVCLENSREDMEEILDQALAISKDELAYSVDRQKAFAAHLKAAVKVAKDQAAADRDYAQRLDLALSKLKARILNIVDAFPDVEFRDSLGRRLNASLNSQPTLELEVDVRSSKSVPNVIDQGAVELLGIDSRYLEVVSYLTLNTDLVKQDLLSGVELEWAKLVRGKHVRGL